MPETIHVWSAEDGVVPASRISLIARVRDTVLIGTACPELNGTDDLGVIIIGPESETIANDWRDYVEEYQASGNKLGDPDNGPSELGAMLDQFAGKHN